MQRCSLLSGERVPEDRAHACAVAIEGKEMGRFCMTLCMTGRAAMAVPSTTSITTRPCKPGTFCKTLKFIELVNSQSRLWCSRALVALLRIYAYATGSNVKAAKFCGAMAKRDPVHGYKMSGKIGSWHWSLAVCHWTDLYPWMSMYFEGLSMYEEAWLILCQGCHWESDS